MYITYTIDSISYCIHTQHTHIIRNMMIVYIYIYILLYYIYIYILLYIYILYYIILYYITSYYIILYYIVLYYIILYYILYYIILYYIILYYIILFIWYYIILYYIYYIIYIYICSTSFYSAFMLGPKIATLPRPSQPAPHDVPSDPIRPWPVCTSSRLSCQSWLQMGTLQESTKENGEETSWLCFYEIWGGPICFDYAYKLVYKLH